VHFVPVRIVGSDVNGMWVAGLPEEARIITVGQDYVQAGLTGAPRPRAGAALKPEHSSETGRPTAGAQP
jgi:membrane fusion protein, multidrug efflux system